MVQRKVPNKLGIQADHVKSEKRLGNLKPFSSQHQDGKNRGADLKKKMKKSRLFKRSDFESLRSSTLRQEVPQPGKPPPQPPLHVPATAQKQSPLKASDSSPNYMKSTSSSDARKEQSQVSSRNFQTGTDSKSLSRKISNSTKLVRTLTKTPSFKPVRAMVKKCSQVAICKNFNEQRATCSSTLKDSKFPSYLTLSPGGTESEGTSVMKVCPYTYCSLNGHRHTPLPPLKCFLSARRRMLKTQKSMKLGCLSPRRVKPSSNGMKEIDAGHVTVDKKPTIQAPDLNSSAINPLMKEECMDFFIEIYFKNREDTADNDNLPSAEGSDETASEHDYGQVVEKLSDEALHFEIDVENNEFDQNSYVISTEMDIADLFPTEDQNVEAANEVYPPSSAQQESTMECSSNQSDFEIESPASIEPDEPDAEVSDMEWEEGPYSAPYLDDDEIDNSTHANNESDMKRGFSLETENPSFHDEPIFKSDDIVSSCIDEISANAVLQEFFEQESVNFEARLGDSDSDTDGSYQNLESHESIQVSNNQSHNPFSPTHNAAGELTITEERDGNEESNDRAGTIITSAPIEDPTEEPRAASEEKNGDSEADTKIPRMNLQLGDNKTEYTGDIKDEALTDHQENEDLQDNDATALLGNQQLDPYHDFTEQNHNEAYTDYAPTHDIIEVEQSDAVIEKGRFSEEVFDECLLPRTEDSETDQNSLEQDLPTVDAGYGMEEGEEVDAAKSSLEVTFDILQGFSEAYQDTTNEDIDESQIDAIAKHSKLSQPFVDEGLAADTQDHSSDEQSQSNDVVENQNQSEKDLDAAEKFKVINSLDSQDQTHSWMNKFRLEENSNQEVDKMEVEDRTKSDAEEICPAAKNTASPETEDALFHAGINSNQELPKSCSNSRGTVRFKRSIEDWEEPRKFNPREPNYLPVEPHPEAEKIDLRHQMMDERKNAEEWMVDYALRQAVTKLAPSRKRKVALLVEAFETVMPIPKWETRLRHTSAASAHARPIQACR